MGCRLSHALRLQFSVTCEDKPDLNLKKRYNFPWTEKANHFLGFRHVFLTKIFLNSAREGTLVSFGEGKLHKPTKKLFQSLTTISVSQSLYRDFSAKKIPKKQKTWWNEWSQKLVINHKPAPLSVKTLLCESNDKCCEQSCHYANIADGSQAFYKYMCMKEQHQSPRITTENLAFRWIILFLLQNKTPHIK